jgi:hypothetical protein
VALPGVTPTVGEQCNVGMPMTKGLLLFFIVFLSRYLLKTCGHSFQIFAHVLVERIFFT